MTRKTIGGPNLPAKAITEADLVENGGDYTLASHTAIPVRAAGNLDRGLQPLPARAYLPVTEAQIAAGTYKLQGGPAQPIYEVAESYEDDTLIAYPVYVVEGEFGGDPEPPSPGFDEDALVYWGAMAVQPSADRKAHDNTFILALKAAGVWGKRDAIWVLAAQTQQAGLLNMKQRAHDATIVAPGGNPVVFTVDRGMQVTFSGGIDGYLNLNYAPATQGIAYQRADASLVIYSRTHVDDFSGSFDVGVWNFTDNSLSVLNPLGLSQYQFCLNTNGYLGYEDDPPLLSTTRGFFGADRFGDTDTSNRFYVNGVLYKQQGGDPVGIGPIPGGNLFGLTANTEGSPSGPTGRQLAYIAVGGHLTDAEHAAEFAAVEALMDAIGAGVV